MAGYRGRGSGVGVGVLGSCSGLLMRRLLPAGKNLSYPIVKSNKYRNKTCI